MKKILKFLLIIAVFMPFMANAECTSSTPENDCVCPGWEWNASSSMFGGECTQCASFYYNPGNDSRSCLKCGSYDNSVWSWAETASDHPGNSVFNPADDNTTGLSYCPWVCTMNYYRSSYDANTGAGECTECPEHSTSAQGATDINACTCQSGYYKTTNANGGLIDNTFTCQSCGNDWTGCENAGATSATVGCPSGRYKTIGTNGVVTCRSCGDYAFVGGNNECVCKGNTYGDPYAGCTKCPAGMLTVVTTPESTAIHDPTFQGEPGATSIRQCKIGAFTKFCNGNGTHCMRLMQ